MEAAFSLSSVLAGGDEPGGCVWPAMLRQRFVFGAGGVEGLALDRWSTPNECAVVFFQ